MVPRWRQASQFGEEGQSSFRELQSESLYRKHKIGVPLPQLLGVPEVYGWVAPLSTSAKQ